MKLRFGFLSLLFEEDHALFLVLHLRHPQLSIFEFTLKIQDLLFKGLVDETEMVQVLLLVSVHFQLHPALVRLVVLLLVLTHLVLQLLDLLFLRLLDVL